MYEKFRIQRSRPSRLNGVAPKNRIGTLLVRKKCRTSEMFFSRRRCCPEPAANAASVPTLTSRGLAVGLERRGAFATVALATVGLAAVALAAVAAVALAAVAFAVRFAGVDLPVAD